MNDLISRQAAIDALHEYFDEMLETDTLSPSDVYGLIEILPPVQAEQKITHCENCKHKHLEKDVLTCPFGLPGGPKFFCGYGSDTNE